MTAVRGISCGMKDEVYLKLYTVISTYCAAIPEKKDMGCARHLNRTSHPFPKRHIERND